MNTRLGQSASPAAALKCRTYTAEGTRTLTGAVRGNTSLSCRFDLTTFERICTIGCSTTRPT